MKACTYRRTQYFKQAYHGLPDLTNSEGLHTNAVYGFLNIMFKILDEEKPDYLTVAFDVHAPTFRHRMFDAYKGTRKPMDEELRQQVPMIKEMLTAMGIKIVEKEAMSRRYTWNLICQGRKGRYGCRHHFRRQRPFAACD